MLKVRLIKDFLAYVSIKAFSNANYLRKRHKIHKIFKSNRNTFFYI